jgi:hypothetical protein
MSCKSFGVSCNYGQKSSNLELSGEGTFQLQVPSLNETMRNMINGSLKQLSPANSDSHELYQLSENDLQVFHRSQTRTIFSLTTERTVDVYRSEALKLTCCVRFTYANALHALVVLIRDIRPAPFLDARCISNYNGA